MINLIAMKFFRIIPVILILLSGCIGTDYVDDPIGAARITVEVENIALIPGQTFQANADYFDQYGIKQNVNFVWVSSNPSIAEVDANGFILAKEPGQTGIQPSYGEIKGPTINVTVVTDPDAVALVEITSPVDRLFKDEKVQLQIITRKINGDIITGRPVEWYSENESILGISSTGEITGKSSGTVGVYAQVDGVRSNTIQIHVDPTILTGSFASASFVAEGTATLQKIDNELILTLSDDFKTEFHIATHIYLANSTNGSEVRAMGVDLGQIYTNGRKVINVTQLYPEIKLQDYRYVISLCKPATVTFSHADLH
jgi:uncharacterized protein YjdB